ncbi:MAG TPA: RNA polymerase sigma factor [Thermoanaerobaculia bacterium]
MTAEPESADRALVARFLARRDESSFRAIYARHGAAVFALAARLSGSESDGEDVLQEAWIRAAEGLERFRWESTLRTWLCGIAVNCWRELRRRRGDADVAHAPLEDDPPDFAPLPAVERVDLERAVRALPDGYRDVVVLHDVQGYTHQEIASLLGIDVGTSKSQLSRGRRRLREALGDRTRTARGNP